MISPDLMVAFMPDSASALAPTVMVDGRAAFQKERLA